MNGYNYQNPNQFQNSPPNSNQGQIPTDYPPYMNTVGGEMPPQYGTGATDPYIRKNPKQHIFNKKLAFDSNTSYTLSLMSFMLAVLSYVSLISLDVGGAIFDYMIHYEASEAVIIIIFLLILLWICVMAVIMAFVMIMPGWILISTAIGISGLFIAIKCRKAGGLAKKNIIKSIVLSLTSIAINLAVVLPFWIQYI